MRRFYITALWVVARTYCSCLAAAERDHDSHSHVMILKMLLVLVWEIFVNAFFFLKQIHNFIPKCDENIGRVTDGTEIVNLNSLKPIAFDFGLLIDSRS